MTPQELKSSILLLAVTGRIVCQDSADEPAVHLIDAIRNKQNQLLSDGVIKREKFNSEIDLENDLPDGWCYAKLGELTTVVTKQTGFDYSKTIKPNLSEAKLPGMIPMVQTKNFKGKQFVFETDYYIPETIAKEFPKILLDSKCMLLSIVGASIGNIGIYPGQPLAMIGGAICKVTLIDDRLYDYLYYFLQSPLGQQEIKKNLKATAQGTITVQDVREITIKVPPLAEQKRIVAKIEELLPLIERYEKAWSRLEDFNKRFPVDMQKSILQMAIQGKLVEQRPEEGTGEELYRQIQVDSIATVKSTPSFSSDELPFDIPESWKYVRIENIAILHNGRAYKQNELLEEGKYPVLRVGNLFTSSNWYYSNMELEPEKYCDNEDLLYSWSASFGPHIWRGEKVIYHYHIWKIEFSQMIDKKFLYYFMLADTDSIKSSGHGLAMIHVTKAGTEKRVFPLPPLAEQKRIVARLEELMPLCEKLR